MNNASINMVCNEGKPSKVAIQDIMHSTITERNATMIKKGFIMVKVLLAWLLRVINPSGPSPSISFTSSTNIGSNYNKQHNKAENKSALKI